MTELLLAPVSPTIMMFGDILPRSKRYVGRLLYSRCQSLEKYPLTVIKQRRKKKTAARLAELVYAAKDPWDTGINRGRVRVHLLRVHTPLRAPSGVLRESTVPARVNHQIEIITRGSNCYGHLWFESLVRDTSDNFCFSARRVRDTATSQIS